MSNDINEYITPYRALSAEEQASMQKELKEYKDMFLKIQAYMKKFGYITTEQPVALPGMLHAIFEECSMAERKINAIKEVMDEY